MRSDQQETLSSPERRRALRDAGWWFALAVAALAVAGALALVLVLGRVPQIAPAVMQTPDFARRSLVVHVNLSLGVWFFACVAGLFCLLPGARRVRTAPVAVSLAALGSAAFVVPTFFESAAPLLSNYVPALDDTLFLAGLAAFAGGVALNFIDPRILPRTQPRDAQPSDIPPEAAHGVRAAAVVYLIALLTIGGAYLTQDADMAPLAYFERLFWGGGHVLQVVSTMGMVCVWLILLRRLVGRAATPPRVAGLLFALLLLPTLAGPWLTLGGYSGGWFTRMMQYGIFPAVTVFLLFGLAALWTHRRELRAGVALVGLLTSAVLTVIGFLLGAMITASNTLIPAHYHANIGAVTISYMTLLLVLLPRFGMAVRWPRIVTWQPLFYGVGQLAFVAGLAIAGIWGSAERKTYGHGLRVHTTGEWIGLITAGIGGVVALLGGMLFVVLVIRAATARRAPSAAAWTPPRDAIAPQLPQP